MEHPECCPCELCKYKRQWEKAEPDNFGGPSPEIHAELVAALDYKAQLTTAQGEIIAISKKLSQEHGELEVAQAEITRLREELESQKHCYKLLSEYAEEKNKRLGVAEGRFIQPLASGLCSDCELENGKCIHQQAMAFLTPANSSDFKTEPLGKEFEEVLFNNLDSLLVKEPTAGGECVVVRREDLRTALIKVSGCYRPMQVMWMDRLKAALDKEKP